jgi:four helix bundle protein
MAGQMRRAALSVPSNVAEGHATGARGRYQYHVRISLGSVAELLTCLELALRGGYVDGKTKKQLDDDLTRTSQLLHGVVRSLRRQAGCVEGEGLCRGGGAENGRYVNFQTAQYGLSSSVGKPSKIVSR